jgi:potassium-transporting ATPase KdpC subunit
MKELSRAVLIFIVFAIGTGLVYPFVVTGVSQLLFKDRANGSLLFDKSTIRGSVLIGQRFTDAKYFHGRPSTNNYDATNSGGSNFGPSSRKFLEDVARRIRDLRRENGLQPDASVPPDLVLASASGLDPDISLEGAMLQVSRVAKARGLSREHVARIVRAMAEWQFGQGQARVNFLRLNLALDASQGR